MSKIYITSIGQTCCELQRPFASIERAITTLGIKPEVRIDGVKYYAIDDMKRVKRHLESEAR